MTRIAPSYFEVDWQTFRADLLNFQRDLGLNNTDFANALGISLGTLTRYLNGERAPASEILMHLLLLMGKTPRDYISEGSEAAARERMQQAANGQL